MSNNGLMVPFFLKLETGVSIGNISLSDPKVEDLALTRDLKILATMSVFHLDPVKIRNGIPCTPHGR